jgi:hypothetical protein
MFISSMLIFGTIGLFRRLLPLSPGFLAFSRGIAGGLFLLLFMKLGKRMGTLKAALLPLEEAELVAVEAVSDCGPGERLYRGAAALPDEAPYMTTVIVRDRRA